MSLKCLAALIPFICFTHVSSKKIPLVIGGVFDIDTKPGDENSASMIPIVRMAIKHVNSCPKTLVDYELQMEVKDVKCQDSDAIYAFTEFIREEKRKIMILGPGCSKSAEPFAKAAPFYNLVQVAMAAVNPALSCAKIFPTFMRTIPPEHFQNQGRVAIVKHFKWRRVAIMRENMDTYQGLSNDLIKRLKKAGIQLASDQAFTGNAELQIEALQKNDLRIIFGMFSEKAARKVICTAFKKGFYGSKVVWILMAGGYKEQWWGYNDVNCTKEELCKALGNFLSTEALMIGKDNQDTIAGKNIEELRVEYKTELAKTPYKEPSRHAAFAYDAVWTIALTLNESISALQQQNETRNMSLEDFDYTNTAMRKTFMKIAKGLSFQGMSGLVQFYKNSDRLSLLNIDQRQRGVMKRIGTYDMKRKLIVVDRSQTALWEAEKVPACTIKKIFVPRYLPKSMVFAMDGLCALGIIFAAGLFFFNVKYRAVRHIRMSSPNMNNIIIVGCVLIYVSGILFGIDTEIVSKKTHERVCQTSAWTASFGFTMAFGALFSKTWRIHRIFMNKLKKTVIQDYQLIIVVILLLMIDACILSTWQILDPMHTTSKTFPRMIDQDADIALYPYQTLCTSKYESLWTGLLYGYKGFLLLFCTYLAWETRKVHIPALNDSKQIGFAVYNVFIPCVIIIPILNLLSNRSDAVYLLSTLLCIFCTTITQCLIFVPKISTMKRTNGDPSNSKNGSFSTGSSVSSKIYPSLKANSLNNNAEK
ncbi:gamma-aminobutyric acid type B receptor subunit 2-like [Stylophora pistillata]|uniref:gamma-aminobutyric acid type B receptor subunit 2-like n=1 Tax=Stylophora pistillata TaxID=50429 RepID=UPI000C051E7C|nr:gamma-aminobutyric acid type B receptor subunit 2-like [Stylophora pistillata]